MRVLVYEDDDVTDYAESVSFTIYRRSIALYVRIPDLGIDNPLILGDNEHVGIDMEQPFNFVKLERVKDQAGCICYKFKDKDISTLYLENIHDSYL